VGRRKNSDGQLTRTKHLIGILSDIYFFAEIAAGTPSACCQGMTELSMGPFCVQSNPTHQLIDPNQPNPLQLEKFGPNPTQYKLTMKLTV